MLLRRIAFLRKSTVLFSPRYQETIQTRSKTSNIEDENAPVEMSNPYTCPVKRCMLCGVDVDYKNTQLLSQFVSSFTGLRLPKKSTSLCDRKFEEISEAITLSRSAGFMSYMVKEPAFLRDPTHRIHSKQQ